MQPVINLKTTHHVKETLLFGEVVALFGAFGLVHLLHLLYQIFQRTLYLFHLQLDLEVALVALQEKVLHSHEQ